jgi:pyruvate dehydrogenase E1 component alpha subunit
MTDIDDDRIIEMYRLMVKSRVMDERMTEMRASRGAVWYSSIGCEATVVGSFYGLKKNDVISPHYRNYAGGMLTRGVPMTEILGNFMGKRSQEKRWADYGLVPRITGTEGTYIPITAGISLAAKLKGDDRVVVASCGDGSTGLGDFHEGINLASVKDLPWVLVVLNNQAYMHCQLKDYLRTCDIAGMANSYGIPGVLVDGNDVLAVHEAVQDAVALARSGGGPTLIECRSFRMSGHFDPDPVDPDLYWPQWRSDVEKWREHDPIKVIEKEMLERGFLSPEKTAAIRVATEFDFEDALAAVELLPPLDEGYVAEITRNVFSGGV